MISQLKKSPPSYQFDLMVKQSCRHDGNSLAARIVEEVVGIYSLYKRFFTATAEHYFGYDDGPCVRSHVPTPSTNDTRP